MMSNLGSAWEAFDESVWARMSWEPFLCDGMGAEAMEEYWAASKTGRNHPGWESFARAIPTPG